MDAKVAVRPLCSDAIDEPACPTNTNARLVLASPAAGEPKHGREVTLHPYLGLHSLSTDFDECQQRIASTQSTIVDLFMANALIDMDTEDFDGVEFD